ncbi:S-methyl-5-thioribose-1-phosphate isomerase [Gimesia fumaroli]|uniref:Methylthioribose-1-phosphate isomerase n=1 Tax=Gimesia fumaroli TaxID=2527976 RepID=A0A518I7J1_9PLAN|nr:S-methyl-5-thioribose-1-phosphate isomerase [Gimesia fumaroli]QDV49058.1 Methylthioribose-1-phosphate isomerase [Gimesia fumaroli]
MNLENQAGADVATMRWVGGTDGYLKMIDQTLLPTEFREIECRDVETVWEAIKKLRVRGAPAIGIAAAYGVVLALQTGAGTERPDFDQRLIEAATYLSESRPTAVNLFWALERMQKLAESSPDLSNPEMHKLLLEEAQLIEVEDLKMCHQIGEVGAELLSKGDGVLTHCNAGGLATSGGGTALAVFFEAARQGKQIHVYADETRPLLQGARLTTWELMQRGIPVTLISDSMAGWVMKEQKIQAVVTGADRIAANGDAANKIGTYSVALLASLHDIPFYIAAPSSTFDLSLESGEEIPIEERLPEEITNGFGKQTAPDGVDVYNPAFDVTPAKYIQGIITERGLIEPVTKEEVLRVLGSDPA